MSAHFPAVAPFAETVAVRLDVEGIVAGVGLARTSFDAGTFAVVAVAAAAVGDRVVVVLAAVLHLARVGSPVEEVGSDQADSNDDAEGNEDNDIPAVTSSSRHQRSSYRSRSAAH